MPAPVNPLSAQRSWQPLLVRSRRLLRETQADSGAWPASPDFPPYRFCWFRDGSFIAEGADAAGLHDEAGRFHAWCADVLVRERAAVAAIVSALSRGEEPTDEQYLPARYDLDGNRHIDDWWNFQVDGYGTWLWALERHLARTEDGASPYAAAIETATRYLIATGRRTCRDWWEEHRDQRHVATLAGVAGGLRAAVRMGTLDKRLADDAAGTATAARRDVVDGGVAEGRLAKWLHGTEVDASLLSLAALYDVLDLDDPLVVDTVRAVEDQLTSGAGPTGVHRYPSDTFYGGGQWPVLACLLAWHHVRCGDRGRAAELLQWVVDTADDDQLLPEQAGPRLAAERLAEWEQRWGPSAHPLVWSHGMFLAVTAVYEAGSGASGGSVGSAAATRR